MVGLASPTLYAQSVVRDPSIANLPRPGYEPRTIILGSTVLQPRLDVDATYNDNILATHTNREADAIFSVRPSVTLQRKGGTVSVNADVHANAIRYATNSRENVETFGAAAQATATLSRNQTVSANIAFDRTFERRSDPEADINRSLSPALINVASADLSYQRKGKRLGIAATASIAKIDYLPVVDQDRDLLTYRVSTRGSLLLGKRMTVFIEPFVNRRDARLRVDRSGIDRDSTTTGVLGGVAVDLGDTLQGSIGIGAFRLNPSDPSLRSFTGLSASGRLLWRPRVRTAVIFDVFRGDVATNRVGATGRIDTRIGLSLDQEVRHNLLLHTAIGYRDVSYRGIDRSQRYLRGELEARYLFDRHLALVVGTAYTRRSASLDSDRFNAWQAMVGLSFAY